jgi:hypothetical protein
MKILVCDRCGFELSDRDEISQALEGAEAWQQAARDRGEDPRGLYPCKHYLRCSGQMCLQSKRRWPWSKTKAKK